MPDFMFMMTTNKASCTVNTFVTPVFAIRYVC